MADQQVPEEKLPTAAEFEAAINRALAEGNMAMVGQLQLTATLSLLKHFENHEKKIGKLGGTAILLLQNAGLLRTKNGAAAPQARGNGAPQRPAGQPRKGANGELLTPEESAVEDMMDSAVVDNNDTGGQVAAVGQGPANARAVQQRHAQTRAASAPLPPGTKTMGNDGAPLTPEEIEMERMMDEAPVENG